MADRKPIPQKMRFEVLKRDDFTCQYCGARRGEPGVELQVDHVIPVAEGGGNEMTNLVTACRDCNIGKCKTLLSDDTALETQRKRIEEAEARKEELRRLAEKHMALAHIEDEEADAVASLVHELTGYNLTERELKEAAKIVSQFGVEEVFISTRLAFDRYPCRDDAEFEHAFSKIGGICYNRANPRCGLCKEKVDEDGDVVECKTYGEMTSDSARICPIYSPWFGGGFR